ncbi:Armadillo [Artemisia annua]|uniref:Kinesin-like protein n=1 Tax=Artemisia annua TaxID=35608 RepID=A0A2U1PCG0_ARTAN|nr:Armadillo [Artemisia annua]
MRVCGQVFFEAVKMRFDLKPTSTEDLEHEFGVLNGYNGTGKTFTLGKLGKDDASERGIMVWALEDIISGASPAYDSVEISYLQIYMESVQDFHAPEKVNIPIVEDPRNGEVSVPGTAVVKIQNVDHFLHLLQIGEPNRHAANIKMTTESFRRHAILMVSFRRSIQDKENNTSSQGKDDRSAIVGGHVIPTVRKSKLLIVDLAGSERLDNFAHVADVLEEGILRSHWSNQRSQLTSKVSTCISFACLLQFIHFHVDSYLTTGTHMVTQTSNNNCGSSINLTTGTHMVTQTSNSSCGSSIMN